MKITMEFDSLEEIEAFKRSGCAAPVPVAIPDETPKASGMEGMLAEMSDGLPATVTQLASVLGHHPNYIRAMLTHLRAAGKVYVATRGKYNTNLWKLVTKP